MEPRLGMIFSQVNKRNGDTMQDKKMRTKISFLKNHQGSTRNTNSREDI